MRTGLVLLSVGIAMLGSVGLAHAESPVVVSTKRQMEMTKAAQRMALTDEQLSQVTAGHLRGDVPGSLRWHWGDYEVQDRNGVWTTYRNVWHRG
jgi:hypothetical protein